MMNGLQSLTQWNDYFGKPSATLLGTMNAMYPVGKILGVPIVTYLNDRFGRTFPLRIGLPFLLFAAAIQGSAQNVGWFIAGRFLVGIGTVFVAQPSPILVTELAYPVHRGRITGIYYASNVSAKGAPETELVFSQLTPWQYLGTLIAAWITYGTFRMAGNWSWRIPSLLQAACPFIQCLGVYFLPESPRWLIGHGKSNEAREVLVKYHAGGDTSSPLVDFEMAEMEASIRLEKESLSQTSYLDLLRTAPNRKRSFISLTIGIYSYWAGAGIISYYLHLVLNTIGITAVSLQTLVNGLLAIMNFIVAICAGLLVDRAGRRLLFLLSASGMLLSFVIWTILSARFSMSKDTGLGKGVVAFVFIFFFFFQVAFAPFFLGYPVEIWPYMLRARGVSVTLFGSWGGLLIGQFVTPIGLLNIGWKYYIVFCVLLALFWFIVYFTFPETRGRTLEEINDIFEGTTLKEDSEVSVASEPQGSEKRDEKVEGAHIEATLK
ncbi:uncharacterized protein A1O9_12854 [Exophiala aquamarina CBS 119918]|uniref:Major facilitator superfamily (MFS) profile domain-containing protein n=1 Tax=Exophiala aquamarina CBS 119918 TaxID=1182545 RepID=A0A072NU11_9EURO|nr:uncharacterized protein A1O9_12854 [Exophiala aquamarina CBS 119918]KEF51131.1 hypothetical protein A1O9_12854 [Exophiala aquamarina CBS 119918]